MSALLEEMRASLSVQEIKGPEINPEVEAYFADCGWKLREIGNDDTTTWCAARIGSALKRCGYPVLPRNVNLLARSYATYGVVCEPGPGAIGVIPRGTAGWQGQVFVIEEILPDGTWQTIGGNQGREGYGKVSRAIVDPRKTEILAVRKPIEAIVAALRPHSSEIKEADHLENNGWLVTFVPAVVATIRELLAPVTVPQFTSLPEALTWWQTIMSAISALCRLVGGHPWLAGTTLVGIICVLAARRRKARRVAKHDAGVPISSQVAMAGA